MKTIPLLDGNCGFDGFYKEAIKSGSDVGLKNITLDEAVGSSHDVVVLTDRYAGYVDKIKADKKILWLMEPPSVDPHIYTFASQRNAEFFKVFTFAKDLVNKFSNFVYSPWGTSFIDVDDQRLYSKSKNISIVASYKQTLEGHQLRHQVIEKYRDKFDGIKQGKKSSDDYKLIWQQEYRYSVAIENSRINGYFTEKIIDCFRTGVMPIYWGDPAILDIFNPDGVIIFNNAEELEDILSHANEEVYNSKLEAVKENYYIAAKYLDPHAHLIESFR